MPSLITWLKACMSCGHDGRGSSASASCGSVGIIHWCSVTCECVDRRWCVWNSPETDGQVTIHGVKRADGRLFSISFLCLVPLMAVSMSVATKMRCALGWASPTTVHLQRRREERGFTWSGPRCPPTWRPAPHAARPSSEAAAPAPHLNLHYVSRHVTHLLGHHDLSSSVFSRIIAIQI